MEKKCEKIQRIINRLTVEDWTQIAKWLYKKNVPLSQYGTQQSGLTFTLDSEDTKLVEEFYKYLHQNFTF